jgi:hypothetical protein
MVLEATRERPQQLGGWGFKRFHQVVEIPCDDGEVSVCVVMQYLAWRTGAR